MRLCFPSSRNLVMVHGTAVFSTQRTTVPCGSFDLPCSLTYPVKARQACGGAKSRLMASRTLPAVVGETSLSRGTSSAAGAAVSPPPVLVEEAAVEAAVVEGADSEKVRQSMMMVVGGSRCWWYAWLAWCGDCFGLVWFGFGTPYIDVFPRMPFGTGKKSILG